MRSLTPAELLAELKHNPDSLQILDVREPWEYALVHLDTSTLIPLGELMNNMENLPKDQPIAVLCHHGVRSAHACYLLERAGFEAINITGGIDRWAQDLDPSMPTY